MIKIGLTQLLAITMILIPNMTNASSLDISLHNTLNQYLAEHTQSQHMSAMQMSILLPNEVQPRNYVAGTQTLNGTMPATTDMLMQWGSITKEFTNCLIIQLMDQGKLKPQTNLITLFPEQFHDQHAWPTAWKNVTVTQLMNMTSGIPDFIDIPSVFADLNLHHTYSLLEVIDQLAASQNQNGCSAKMGCFKAGSAWYYSNTNYLLLGLIVEKLTGHSFAEELNQNILKPFQNRGDQVYYLDSTMPADIQKQMIHGYYGTDQGFNENPSLQVGNDVTDINLSVAASAGGLVGNMAALTHMIYALYHDDIVPTHTLAQDLINTQTGQPVKNIQQECRFPDFCYARGILVSVDPHGNIFYEYLGQTFGYTSYYAWFPKDNVVIAIGQNSNAGLWKLDQFTVLKIYPIIKEYLARGNRNATK